MTKPASTLPFNEQIKATLRRDAMARYLEARQSGRTPWHISVGTHLARLHGSGPPTVDRRHNQPGEPFIWRDERREAWELRTMRSRPVLLTEGERTLIEAVMPAICERGGWVLHMWAAPPPPDHTHLHVLLDAPTAIHGKDIRKWLKRWTTEALDAQFGRPQGGDWWVDGGSTKPVKDEDYFANCFVYVYIQRSTRFASK